MWADSGENEMKSDTSFAIATARGIISDDVLSGQVRDKEQSCLTAY